MSCINDIRIVLLGPTSLRLQAVIGSNFVLHECYALVLVLLLLHVVHLLGKCNNDDQHAVTLMSYSTSTVGYCYKLDVMDFPHQE